MQGTSKEVVNSRGNKEGSRVCMHNVTPSLAPAIAALLSNMSTVTIIKIATDFIVRLFFFNSTTS